ncbi:MAG: zinc-binding dehydrogenase [Pseudomonadota bacterium]
MTAAIIAPTGLVIDSVDQPSPGPNQLLVKVMFAALNRADLAMSAGHKHGNAGGTGTVAGLEWSGVVVETGSAVTDYQPGDRVMCSGVGGYAEFALCDTARCNPIPTTTDGDNGYSFEEAATLPVALQTMHDAIVTNGGLRSGESVLIQGASSGVGILGLQIARYLGASLVIGSSTHAGRRRRLLDLGADMVIDTNDPLWVAEVQSATDDKGVDLIVDQVSGYVANDNMKAARVTGRIVNVGRLGGTSGEFDFDLHARKRITYTGVTFRTRSRAEVDLINRAMREDLWAGLERRAFGIPIDRIFPLKEAAAAQAYMAHNQHFGKILLQV